MRKSDSWAGTSFCRDVLLEVGKACQIVWTLKKKSNSPWHIIVALWTSSKSNEKKGRQDRKRPPASDRDSAPCSYKRPVKEMDTYVRAPAQYANIMRSAAGMLVGAYIDKCAHIKAQNATQYPQESAAIGEFDACLGAAHMLCWGRV